MKKISLLMAPFLACTALASVALAKSAPAPGKDVALVLQSYRQAKAVKAKVDKTVVQETMGTESKSSGDFYFSKGKMRIEFEKPDKTVLVFDGKNFWFESRLDEKHISVTKMRAGDLKKSDSVLASLFDRKDALKSFNFLKKTTLGKTRSYEFEAKDKKKSDVQKLNVALNGKELAQIEYVDRIDNKVTLKFTDVVLGKVDPAKFEYTPPKGATVTEP